MNPADVLTICRCYNVHLRVNVDGRLAVVLPEGMQHFRPALREHADGIVSLLQTEAQDAKSVKSQQPEAADVPFCRGPVVFDIETDGLAPSRIWCVGAIELGNGREHVFGPDELGKASEVLNSALWLIGHNIIGFDVPALRKLRPDFDPLGDCYDTLVLGRMLFPEHHRHRLQDWGERLGFAKGEQPDFDQWSDEMAEYCLRDVQVNVRLWEHLMDQQPPMPAVRLEMQFAQDCYQMTQHGIHFDVDAALSLRQSLMEQQQELRTELQATFSNPDEPEAEFNPGSSKQIAAALHRKHGWTAETSAAGNPVCNEAALKKLAFPEAQQLLGYREITGHIGKVSDGPTAWLNRVTAGRIHHRINTCATITGRCTHSRPNLAQVPAKSQFRQLFKPSPGKVLVGVDLSGIEARCLAHYLHQYDAGQFAQTLLQGDIHEFNRQAAGLETRDQAKTMLYASLYGGGPARIGEIIGGGAAAGKAVLDRWLQQVPAMKQLKADRQQQFKAFGWIEAIDGRRIKPRKAYTVLNSLMQACGAVIAKLWAVLAVAEVGDAGQMLLHVHDEIQFETAPEHAESVAAAVVEAAGEAGRRLKLNIPVAAEAKVGDSWAETH